MKLIYLHILTATFLLLNVCHGQANQKNITRVDAMPDLPQPFHIIDYNKLAKDFDKTVYDFNAKGKFWPMIWIDKTRKNFDQDVAGIYTAIGDVRQGPNHNKGMFHEALANMGAVLGASLVNIDKSKQQYNYVSMLKNYFNKETGWNIMMNNTCPEVALLGGGYGRDWWYDVYPNLLFYAIYDLYPDEKGFTEIARSIADKFYAADSILNGDYNYSYFDYGTMQPKKNNICAQPDAAAGHAWVLYAAYKKFKDPKYLRGAASALAAMEKLDVNPTYELLMPFGAYMGARLNAETGNNFDLKKLLDWSFDGTAVCREGWGVLVGKWNGYDISGVVGSTVDHGGYGFLMNTYDAAWPLVPLVRYDPSYATAIGKWMLNAANASRFFYPQYIPKQHQTIPELASVTKGVIAYEGFIKQSSFDEYKHLKAPVAQGDGPLWVLDKNPKESQFSVYGSGHAGIFGSIIKKTNVSGILQLDLLATDFFKDKSYPTYLYYNPYGSSKSVAIKNSLKNKIDLYDAVTGKFVAKNIAATNIKLLPKSAAVIVCVPAGSKIKTAEGKLWANDVVIDYKINKKQAY